MEGRTPFYQILMVQSDGRAELIDSSSIAFTLHGDYNGNGLRNLDDLLTTLRKQGRIQLMKGYDYPQDVIREITTEEFRNARGVYLLTQRSQKGPVTNLEKMDLDF